MRAERVGIAVVGGGPAGIAAAVAARACGAPVVLLDDNPDVGGQIWRRVQGGPAGVWRERVKQSGAEIRSGVTVFDAERTGGCVRLRCDSAAGPSVVDAERVVLATGARELFLPFPGWTLPGVFGVGGLQALAKNGLDVRGKRIVVGGTGPLLLAVAAFLNEREAKVELIAEQAERSGLLGFAGAVLGQPGKLWQGAKLRASIIDVEYRFGAWITEARGEDRVRQVVMNDGRVIDVDAVACGFGLVGNTQLAQVVGAGIGHEKRDSEVATQRDRAGAGTGHLALGTGEGRTGAQMVQTADLKTGPWQGRVVVDDLMRTSVGGVLCAGEPLGIGGVETSLVEGTMAGYSAAGREELARGLIPRRRRERAFAAAMERAFALREEVLRLARPETIVCRCEDVAMARIASCDHWRGAKLLTRCGMGPCQGRVCGAAVEAMMGWAVRDVRPPVFPVSMNALSATGGAMEGA
ncbi:MAG: FAD-dependent oxidoreductase [Phycisphaerales bacterium]|jgi:thioredoxin reductase|nr:FAD-dependent oxidoreductase [Phycisphaerales bacterium]